MSALLDAVALLPAAHADCCTRCHTCLLQTPGLAVVLVGERKDSQTYVRNKKKACEEVRRWAANWMVWVGELALLLRQHAPQTNCAQ